MHYPKTTQQAITAARSIPNAKRTKRDKVLLALADGKWHQGRELALKVALRYGARLYELEHDFGVMWDKRLDPRRPKGEMWFQYKLREEEANG